MHVQGCEDELSLWPTVAQWQSVLLVERHMEDIEISVYALCIYICSESICIYRAFGILLASAASTSSPGSLTLHAQRAYSVLVSTLPGVLEPGLNRRMTGLWPSRQSCVAMRKNVIPEATAINQPDA